MISQELQSLLGANVDRFRKLQSLTVEDLSGKADVSVGHLNDVIHGRKWVSSDLLVRLASALSVPVAVLFTPVDAASPPSERLLAEMGKELEVAIGELIRNTTTEYLTKKLGPPQD